ncbi:MAG TPA: alkaline phosphatase family protein [Rudaea sp.]|nr:alkaline phosphatase family protein [Rudaea sp.]
MNKTIAALGLAACAFTSMTYAAEGAVPTGIPHLDHVFVIMMENHGYSQIIDNPNAPFTNSFALTANLAANYYAVAHPSLSNYLEIVGGSNFGIQSDNYPDWHNFYCTTSLASGVPNTDTPASPAICPIAGEGTDAAVPAIDTTNETEGAPGDINIDGTASIPAAKNTIGMSIADQLVQAGLTWKSYQESLPPEGADEVNISDGYFTDKTNFAAIVPTLNPPLATSNVVALYAAKHNPFVYFQSVQEGYTPGNTLDNSVDFDGANGLYADLASGHVPNYAFIAPNQCNDQHGRGNAGAFCNYDPTDNGTQAGLNPALIIRGDVTVRKLVTAIKASPVWSQGHNAIVVLWDENDYSTAPETNQVPLIVDTNYGGHGFVSPQRYTHFSLLKSIEAGFGLPCLNHACDSSTAVMSDLFSGSASSTAAEAKELTPLPKVTGSY